MSPSLERIRNLSVNIRVTLYVVTQQSKYNKRIYCGFYITGLRFHLLRIQIYSYKGIQTPDTALRKCHCLVIH
jgi:hypothetical protein